MINRTNSLPSKHHQPVTYQHWSHYTVARLDEYAGRPRRWSACVSVSEARISKSPACGSATPVTAFNQVDHGQGRSGDPRRIEKIAARLTSIGPTYASVGLRLRFGYPAGVIEDRCCSRCRRHRRSARARIRKPGRGDTRGHRCQGISQGQAWAFLALRIYECRARHGRSVRENPMRSRMHVHGIAFCSPTGSRPRHPCDFPLRVQAGVLCIARTSERGQLPAVTALAKSLAKCSIDDERSHRGRARERGRSFESERDPHLIASIW